MNRLHHEEQQAIRLRKQGKTYNEILKEVPVAKSTLSLWLRNVHLARRQFQRITERKLAAQRKGAEARKRQKIELVSKIHREAVADIRSLSTRELWLLGIIMYWAEGCKEKEYASPNGVDFANTDPRMHALFIQWLQKCCGVHMSAIYAHLYIHEFQKNNIPDALDFWSKVGIGKDKITGVYFKRHNPKSRRHNYNNKYYGTLRLRVRKSSTLLRKIQGWVDGICVQCRVV